MTSNDGVLFSNISATVKFQLNNGGLYQFSGVATFGGGNIEVQVVLPDGSTVVSFPTACKLTANGTIQQYMPPGQYQLTITTATAVYAAVTRIPLS